MYLSTSNVLIPLDHASCDELCKKQVDLYGNYFYKPAPVVEKKRRGVITIVKLEHEAELLSADDFSV